MNKAETVHKAPLGERTVALFELLKGAVVLLAGLALLALLHTDVQAKAEMLVNYLHADPAWKVTHEFINFASHVNDTRIWLFTFFAVFYALVRFVEAFGLWHELVWAEWFAVLSAGIYLPLEIYQMVHHLTLYKMTIFLGNVAILVYLARLLAAKHYKKKLERMARQQAA